MKNQSPRPVRPRRSVLYVPASNARAMEKIQQLACDAVVYDLEDAVGPDQKAESRERLRQHFNTGARSGVEQIIRINSLSSEWGNEDFLAARACKPDAILLPKVNEAADIVAAEEALAETDAPQSLRLWAMLETPASLLNISQIANKAHDAHGRLDCFVAGANDLAKDTGARIEPGREVFRPWLMQMIAAARAAGCDILDGVWNDFRDTEGFARECREAVSMGFDGKTIIHPNQIEAANEAFSPSAEEIAEAEEIRAAFTDPENAGKGVIQISGKMVERLHLEMAEKLLTKHAAKAEQS